MKARINAAINEITIKTNIQMAPRDTVGVWPRDALFFVPRTSSGCGSKLGRQGGAQSILLHTKCSTGSIIHEIGHTLGLIHEHSRPDRNLHIRVNAGNINGSIVPFNIKNFGVITGPYNFDSVMHYETTAFGKVINGVKLTTIERLATSTSKPVGVKGKPPVIGQRYGLSNGDIKAINFMYPKPTPVTLLNGVPIRNISLAAGAVKEFEVVMPPITEWTSFLIRSSSLIGQSRINVYNPNGDRTLTFDPTSSNRVIRSGFEENFCLGFRNRCKVVFNNRGTYKVILVGTSGYSNVTLKMDIKYNSVFTKILKDSVPFTFSSTPRNADRTFHFYAPKTKWKSLKFELSGASGNADLSIVKDRYGLVSSNADSNEVVVFNLSDLKLKNNLQFMEPGGKYTIDVISLTPYSNLTIKATLVPIVDCSFAGNSPNVLFTSGEVGFNGGTSFSSNPIELGDSAGYLLGLFSHAKFKTSGLFSGEIILSGGFNDGQVFLKLPGQNSRIQKYFDPFKLGTSKVIIKSTEERAGEDGWSFRISCPQAFNSWEGITTQ